MFQELHASFAALSHKMVTVSHDPVDLTELEALINAAIVKYDSDKTGLPDYALETAGNVFLSLFFCSRDF